MSEKIIQDLEDRTRQLSLPKREEMEAMNKLIAGRTGSGKTMYLLKDLENNLMDKYDDIYLICPTYKTNYCYQNWIHKNSKNWHPLHVNLDDVDYVLSILSKNIKAQVILDKK